MPYSRRIIVSHGVVLVWYCGLTDRLVQISCLRGWSDLFDFILARRGI